MKGYVCRAQHDINDPMTTSDREQEADEDSDSFIVSDDESEDMGAEGIAI